MLIRAVIDVSDDVMLGHVEKALELLGVVNKCVEINPTDMAKEQFIEEHKAALEAAERENNELRSTEKVGDGDRSTKGAADGQPAESGSSVEEPAAANLEGENRVGEDQSREGAE